MRLSEVVEVNKRFARSANIERDRGPRSVKGYIPTGRAVDVVDRISRGLSDAASGRTVSITGPHGAGKSSLALFLSALTASRRSQEYELAFKALGEAAPGTAKLLQTGLKQVDREGSGHLRVLVTAEREPVVETVARGIQRAVDNDTELKDLDLPESFSGPTSSIEPRDVLAAIRSICQAKPLLLVIDEFGKNLESYVDSGSSGDPYMLQELAEATQGNDALPVVIVTMQHLAFEEYVQDASITQRREWAKIQGRFQDIPYLETAEQYRQLIAASFRRSPSPLDGAVGRWIEAHGPTLTRAGLGELLESTEESFPLHPLAVAVLPDLCGRYGQNERTLFSFLAGSEPLAVPRLLERMEWSDGEPLPFVGLGAVYDYFLDSSGTSISASIGAGRWLEIESRIRDTAGLTSDQLEVLKVVGVLNLVGTAGTLRASAELVDSARSAREGIRTSEILAELESLGLLTYREFADEYRVWEGSDYDLRRSLDVVRRSLASVSLSDLLNEAAPAGPIAATRHSFETGVLRFFEQSYGETVDNGQELDPVWDGVIVYLTDPKATLSKSPAVDGRARVVCIPPETVKLREIAEESVVLKRVVEDAESSGVDRVARRELAERLAGSVHPLRAAIAKTWDPGSCWWKFLNPGSRQWELLNPEKESENRMTASAAASEACGSLYDKSPHLSNEMIARRELTSQGAKARRVLMEAFLAHPNEETLGIKGYGPERAIYEAVFKDAGIHGAGDYPAQLVLPPSEGDWRPLWTAILEGFRSASAEREPLENVASVIGGPPYGMKQGIIPLLLLVALVHDREETALYEHGSLVLRIDDAVAERLGRNLSPFSIKYLGVTSGCRREVLDALETRLKLSDKSGIRSFLFIVKALFNTMRNLEPYAQRTMKRYTPQNGADQDQWPKSLAVRDAFRNASEPDGLLFELLPQALDIKQFLADESGRAVDARDFSNKLAQAMADLQQAYPDLLDMVAEDLGKATRTYGDLPLIRERLSGGAREMPERSLEQELRPFVGALAKDKEETTDREWLENVAMVVVGGTPPRFWDEALVRRYQIEVGALGGAMRRTRALLYDKLALDHVEQESRLVTITKPDGSESLEVIVLRRDEEDLVDSNIGSALSDLEHAFDSTEGARRALLAWLVLQDNDESQIEELDDARESSG